ncbi:alpha/beta hydrolase [Pedobacter sp. HDW13]|uniref:alpha/beta hydrolase family protein n=1 Tax=unclassified Pedobacter TaxID=2628915 RepID=UPI000F5B06A4|nr:MULTISPECIES: alpha/beta hydrolase [unclassified Pedobacter]QIL38666.1 alpha/beta hydrolase [Pedobacter sp. HDW13]RQO80172.1 alpha/beta hydrolase [Pedobacter sp. KBW01]
MITQSNFSLSGSDGKLIIGDITFDEKNPNTPIILFVHGFKGFKDWGAHNLVARYFASNGYRYIKFNLSHSGVPVDHPQDVTDLETFASNTVSKELFDLNAVLDFIEKAYGTETKVNLIGHSRGGGLSIIEAANDLRIDKLITWSAIADFNSLWKKEQEAEWKKNGKIFVTNARTKEQMPLNVTLLQDLQENAITLNIVEAAKRINIPWLIVQGDDDVNVPFEMAQQLADANPASRLVKIEGANHVYGASQPYTGENLPPLLFKVCEKVLMFLEEA